MVMRRRNVLFVSGAIRVSLFLMVQGAPSLNQDTEYVRKKMDKTVHIPCSASGVSQSNDIHWYQKKDGEPFKSILYINFGSKKNTPNSDHPQKDDFSTRDFDLIISATKLEHSATYYCACWDAHSNT
ncbi:hypothetical protein GN956_G19197 [Arapaima gigas]